VTGCGSQIKHQRPVVGDLWLGEHLEGGDGVGVRNEHVRGVTDGLGVGRGSGIGGADQVREPRTGKNLESLGSGQDVQVSGHHHQVLGLARPVDQSDQSLGLTPRQRDVLALLLQGKPNKLIAREMGLSVETVKDHVAAVLRALGVTSRTQAVLAVSQMGQPEGFQAWKPSR